MPSGGKLCITVYVFGTYSKYIPYYIYSILKSYPDYYVKIFVDTELSPPEKRCMELIRDNLSDNFSICENSFREYDFLNGTQIRGGGKIILRWLLPEREFEGFDYIYIGDVDFLIMREEPSLLESHLNHCKKTQLPFSNKIRLLPNSNVRTDRLTGLHFIIKRPYYEKVGPYISSYLEDRDSLLESLSGINNNEQFLYYLVKQGFDLDKLLDHEDFRPHHGIHLGIARARGVTPSKTLKKLNEVAAAESIQLDKAREFLYTCVEDSLFQQLLLILPEESIFNVCDALNVKMPSRKLKLRSSINAIRQMIWMPGLMIHKFVSRSTK